MPTEVAIPDSLFLYDMEKVDLDRYCARLERLFDIIDMDSTKVERVSDTEAVYRLGSGGATSVSSPEDNATYEIKVSITKLAAAKRNVLNIVLCHPDETSDFAIHDIIRDGAKVPRLDNYDDILDHLECLLKQVDRAFTARGTIGRKVLGEVQAEEAKAAELLNAVVHAYIELGDEDVFTVLVSPMAPYGPALFHQVVEGERFEFLSVETQAIINAHIPPVVMLHYSAVRSFTEYWLGPQDPLKFEIRKKDLPADPDLRRTLAQLAKVPMPHFLDELVPIEG